MADPTPQDQERATGCTALLHMACDCFVSKAQHDRALAEQQKRHANSVDTACGLDDDPKGMSCAPIKPGGKVYHQAGCGREDAEYIRSGNA